MQVYDFISHFTLPGHLTNQMLGRNQISFCLFVFFNCYLICKDIGNATHLYPLFFRKDVREPIVITAHKIITSSPYGTEIFANHLKLNLFIYEYHLFYHFFKMN